MKLGRVTLSALLASTLVAAPVAASAAPVAGSRSSAEVEGEGQIVPGVGLLGSLFLVVVVIAVGYLAFVEDEDEDLPRSP
jgi:hypothetical protein